MLEHINRLIGRQQETEREIKTRVSVVSLIEWGSGTDWRRWSLHLFELQLHSFSYSGQKPSLQVIQLGPSIFSGPKPLTSHPVYQKILFALHSQHIQIPPSNFLSCCLPGSSYCWPGLCWLFLLCLLSLLSTQ